jgi:DNA-binding PadR family transcriptional regulator
MTLTPLALSALGLLVERPMHPYEMYQLMLERHEDWMVKVRPGSLYHSVERLQDAKLVEATGTARAGNRPERTTYAITAAGREALTTRISELLKQPVREYPHFPFAIGEAHNLPAEQVVSDLTSYAEALDDDIAQIDDLIKVVESQGIPEVYWLGGHYLRSMTAAQRDWIRTCITRIESKDLIWQPHLG